MHLDHDIHFRSGTRDDAVAIARLRELSDSSGRPGTLYDHAKRLRPGDFLEPSAPPQRCVVAVSEGQVVGLVSTIVMGLVRPVDVSHRGDVAIRAYCELIPPDGLLIDALAVLPRYRGNRIASRLIKITLQEAAVLGIREVRAVLTDDQSDALHCLRTAGFACVRTLSFPAETSALRIAAVRLLENSINTPNGAITTVGPGFKRERKNGHQ